MTRIEIPELMTKRNQWVAWKSVPSEDPSQKGQKVPINVKSRGGASISEPGTWASFEEVQQFLLEWKDEEDTHFDSRKGEITGQIIGPGYVFTKDDPFTGIDLDNCFDEQGTLEQWGTEVVEHFNSYTERSNSGCGLHIVIEGQKPEGFKCKNGRIECYDRSRFFAMTGWVYAGYSRIEPRQAELESFLNNHLAQEPSQGSAFDEPREYDPGLTCETVLQRLEKTKQAERVERLLEGENCQLPSDSEADLAICNHLAWGVGYVPEDQAKRIIDEIIRKSGRLRPKWDDVHRPDGATYGQITIEKALANTTDKYKQKEEWKQGNTQEASKLMKAAGVSIEDVVKFGCLGQRGCAELFKRINKDRFCFDHAEKRWLIFKDHYWVYDDVGQVCKALDDVQAILKLTEADLEVQIVQIGQQMLNGDANKKLELEQNKKVFENQLEALSKTIKSLNYLNTRKQVVEFAAQGEGSLGTSGEKWDLLPWELACHNGVIDLKTGHLRAGKPNDFIKSVCPTAYDPQAKAPRFEQALKEIFNDDVELITFFQRIMGMALVGENIEHVLIIMWGSGRNGKDTIINSVKEVLGPKLAGAVQTEMLMDQGRFRSSSGPSADIMRLRGLRIAWASEVSVGRKIDAGKIKLLTGGGEIVGRAPYARHEVSFPQSYTLFLLTNTKPEAEADDYALWKRIILIPFNTSFVDDPKGTNEKKKDADLWNKLKAETQGILAWMVDGCLAWQKDGLRPPEIVKKATEEYRNEEDIVLQFVEETCLQGGGFKAQAQTLFEHFKKWAESSGMKPMSSTMFGRKMSVRFEKKKIGSPSYYMNIGIKADHD